MDYEMFDTVEFLRDGEGWCKAIFIAYRKDPIMCTVSRLVGHTMVFEEVLLENIRKPFSLSNDNPNRMFKTDSSPAEN